MSIGNNVQIAIALPQIYPERRIEMSCVREFAVKAENLGYSGLWVQEQVLGNTPVLDSLSLLSYVAAITSTVKLGVSVLVLPLHNPVQLAKRLSTIDQMSGGRLVAGLGLGGGTSHYGAFGLSPEARVRRFVECMRVMKALWADGPARYAGRFYQLDDVSMEPKPVRSPHLLIWLGGRHPNALNRAVRHSDGWMGAGSSSIAEFTAQAAHIRQSLDDAGRDHGTFTISKRVYLAIDDDGSRAERRLRDWFSHYYGNADMASRVCVWGSKAHCLQRLQELVVAGAQHLLLNPVFDQMEHLEDLADFTEAVR